MTELTIAERLLYSTVKVTAQKHGESIGTGTGFFMQFPVDGERFFPAIVTNKHVVDGADCISVICHYADGSRPARKFVKCDIKIAPETYVEHPETGVDLCAVPVGSIMNQARQAGTPIFFSYIEKSIIPTDDIWASLTPSRKS